MGSSQSIQPEQPTVNNQLVWLITGTSSGLGRHLVSVALSRGDLVIATARDPSKLHGLWPEATEHNLKTLQLDVTVGLPALEHIAEEAIGLFGRIDVLVNNAGYAAVGLFEEAGSDVFRQQYETNVFGVINVTCAILPYMRERRSGTIVMIGSRLAWYAEMPARAMYTSSKAALHAFSETLASEVEPLNIRTLIVEPGGFRTEGVFASPIHIPSPSSPHTCPEYTTIREEVAKQNDINFFKADPRKGMEILADVVRGEGKASGKPWPKFLVMGYGARESVEKKCKKMLAEMEDWHDVTSDILIDEDKDDQVVLVETPH